MSLVCGCKQPRLCSGQKEHSSFVTDSNKQIRQSEYAEQFISRGSHSRQMEQPIRGYGKSRQIGRHRVLTFFGAMDPRRRWVRRGSEEEDYELKQLQAILVSVDLRKGFSPGATSRGAPETLEGPRYALWMEIEDIKLNLCQWMILLLQLQALE